jgi:hypothetical protein
LPEEAAAVRKRKEETKNNVLLATAVQSHTHNNIEKGIIFLRINTTNCAARRKVRFEVRVAAASL